MEFVKFFKAFLTNDIDESKEHHEDTCPICGKNKFHANIQTGLWDCKKCGISGNPRRFITIYHQHFLERTERSSYLSLQKSRGVPSHLFRKARWAWDDSQDRWLIPYHTPTDTLSNLGHFDPSRGFKVYKCLPLTPYCPFPREGGDWETFLPKHVSVNEGEHDAVAFAAFYDPDEVYPIGMPGANIFKPDFLKMFRRVTRVYLNYDNDTAGQKGLAKAQSILGKPSRTIEAVDWHLYPEATDGFDIRDLYIAEKSKTREVYEGLLVPYDTIPLDKDEDAPAGYHSDVTSFDRLDTWTDYINEYRNIFYVNEETEMAMQACTAIVLTNHIAGEPLWGFLVGPASAGKTTYIESFGGKNQLFDYVSKITAKSLASGFTAGGQDPSLLGQINNKVLLIKDFTVVLSEPYDKQKELFGILRDAYDGAVKIVFGNGKVLNYSNLRFNMIAGVTDAIHAHNDSEFGERWFKIDYLGQHYNELTYIRSALKKLGGTRGKKEALTKCTLGFLRNRIEKALGEHADTIWDGGRVPDEHDTSFDIPDKYMDRLIALGRFVVRMATKPNNDRVDGIKFRPRHALATRASIQLSKLWRGVSWAIDQDMNEESFKVIAKVARDTSYGFTFDIAQFIYENPGTDHKEIQHALHLPSTRVHRVITDLRTTKLLSISKKSGGRGRNTHGLYLEKDMNSIFETIEG